MIKTHSITWVKKHCTYQDDLVNDGTGSYTFEGHEGSLFTPNMSLDVCSKSFTVVAVHGDFVDVKETPYSIPIWLLTKNSQKEVSHDTNIS